MWCASLLKARRTKNHCLLTQALRHGKIHRWADQFSLEASDYHVYITDMTKILQNGTNKSLTRQISFPPRGPHVRTISGFIVIAFITILYLLSDQNTNGYAFFFGGFEATDQTTYFVYVKNASEKEGERVPGYIVWSPSCRIPDLPPFHESVKKLYAKQKATPCSNVPPLSSVVRQGKAHILRIHSERFERYAKDRTINCCYNIVTRGNQAKSGPDSNVDDALNYSKCFNLKGNTTFKGGEEFIRVKCSTRIGKRIRDVYTNMHAFVGIKKRIKNKIEKHNNGTDKFSVMIIGIDSISRLNLIRTMPKTVEHLNKTGWYYLNGYNKMEDNTFPNLMAILAGRTVAQIRKLCWSSRNTYLDSCPLIWRNFSDKGYVTGYGEDEPTISTFNFHKNGFFKPPTDYYMRPFMLAAQKSTKTKTHASLNVCLGPVSVADHILNYIKDFSYQLITSVPTFSLYWLNSFSHNDLNTPTTMDSQMVTFFKDLTATGIYNSTIILFLSDHGMRFGKIRETYIGYLEERLPFIYFWIPPAFRSKFPNKIKNLLLNRDRLTSPFDLHVTLTEILGEKSKGTEACPKCVSLFDQVPWNRSCNDAGISNHWCTCAEYKMLPTETAIAANVVSHVASHINGVLSRYTHFLSNGTKCSPLSVKKVHSLRRKVFAIGLDWQEYVVLFQTVPGDGMFEATVSHNKTFEIMDTISRVNSYYKQSYCMNDAYAKKYCYCEKRH